MLNKIIKIVGYAVIGITAIIGILFFINDAPVLQAEVDAITDMPQELKPAALQEISDNWGATVFNWGLFLFIASGALAILFAIYRFVINVINDPRTAIKPAITVAILALIVIISYSLASDAIPQFIGADRFEVTPATSKNVETSMWIMYILFGMSVLAAVYSEVSRLWK